MSALPGVRRLRRLAAGLAVGLVAAGAVAAAPAALGQEEQPERDLSIRSVDATAYPDVTMVVTTPGATSLDVRQNGEPVGDLRSSGLDEANISHLTVLAVDLSKAMAREDSFDHTALGLKQIVLGKSPDELMALVTFGVNGRTTVPPTTDTEALLGAIDGLELSTREEASRNEAVREALDLVRTSGADVADIVLVSASSDDSSTISESAVVGGSRGEGVVVHAVGVDLGDLDAGALRRLAGATPSGSFVEAATANDIVPALQSARRALDAVAAITYRGAEGADVLDIEIQAEGQRASALVNAGHHSSGAQLRPGSATPELGKGPSFLRDANAKFFVLGLALVTFVLLAYGVFLLAMRDDTDLESVLSHYDDRPVTIDEDDDDPAGGMVQSKLLRRAVALTSKVAEQQGLLTKVERMLERADLPLRPAEALFLYLTVLAVGAVLALFVTGSMLLSVMVLAIAALVPPSIVNMKAAKRRATFQAQLPDMLNLLAGSLRAGYSLMQGVEAVSREVQDPMGAELRRVVVEARLGRPLDEALEDASKRMGSPDFAWTVMAIRIQREVGGNLAELLLTVADTMVQRERLRRDVKSLTAEGRVSAVVLAILPPALMGAMYTVNPNYIKVLFTERTGNFLLGGSTVMALVGFAWMKKLAKVEV